MAEQCSPDAEDLAGRLAAAIVATDLELPPAQRVTEFVIVVHLSTTGHMTIAGGMNGIQDSPAAHMARTLCQRIDQLVTEHHAETGEKQRHAIATANAELDAIFKPPTAGMCDCGHPIEDHRWGDCPDCSCCNPRPLGVEPGIDGD